jgi:hypothetical protein
MTKRRRREVAVGVGAAAPEVEEWLQSQLLKSG